MIMRRSLALLYSAASLRLGAHSLPVSDPTKMNFGTANTDGTTSKAWRDIWGCGQGIGPVDAVVPTAELVGRLTREYDAARARLRL